MAETNFLIKILPGEGCNPDFAPDAEDQEGLELDGFVLMGFVGGDMKLAYTTGVTIHEISEGIASNMYAQSVACLRASFALAEGKIRASQLMSEADAREQRKAIRALFGGGMEDDQAGN
jgi:hypothetical protein